MSPNNAGMSGERILTAALKMPDSPAPARSRMGLEAPIGMG